MTDTRPTQYLPQRFMPETPINLGRKWDSSCCCPSPAKDMEESVHYPSLYIETGEALELPENGTMTVKFQVTRREESGTDKKRYCVNVDVIQITDVKAGAKKKEKSGEEALDEYMAESEEKE